MNAVGNIRFALLVLGLCGLASPAQSQSAWADSLALRVGVLKQLHKSDHLERAQLEAMSLMGYLETRHIPCSAEALQVMNGVFWENKDRESAGNLFAKAESDARQLKDPALQVQLYASLEKCFAVWGREADRERVRYAHDAALQAWQSRQQALSARALVRERDSLALLLHVVRQSNSRHWLVDSNALAGAVATTLGLFMLLLLAWGRSHRRWKNRWVRREQEIGLEKAAAGLALSRTEPLAAGLPDSVRHASGQPEHVALLIEPNRPISLYLKSLLSDRFRVETATTPNEALLRAGDLLPDLIICDAVLNGHTGIEVVRQIKLSDRTNHIPVILLVENHGAEAQLDARRAGADTWFVRPLPDDELYQQVDQLFQTRKQQHRLFDRHLHLYFTEWRTAVPDLFLQKVLECVEANLSNPDYLPEDLSRQLQLTRPHFVRKLLALTGRDPQQLIRELRLEKAKVLLEKRAAPPQVVAELVGFSSPGSFAKAFRDYFGDDALLLKK